MTVALNIDGNNPNQIQSYQIEGENFYIHTVWNHRQGWCMAVYDTITNPAKDPSITPLLGRCKAMPNGLMTWRYSRAPNANGLSLFSGDILIMDTQGVIGGEITRDNFGEGRRFVPTYFTQQELEDFNVSAFTSYTKVG